MSKKPKKSMFSVSIAGSPAVGVMANNRGQAYRLAVRLLIKLGAIKRQPKQKYVTFDGIPSDVSIIQKG